MRLLFILSVLFAASAAGEWIDLGNSDFSNATVQVIETGSDGFTVDLILPGFENTATLTSGHRFNTISVPALTPYSDHEGAPTLPKGSFMAAVPADGDITVTVTPLQDQFTLEGVSPSPMQPIPVDSSWEPVPFTYDPAAYAAGTYPASNTDFELTGTIRGVTMGRFNILPFSWNAVTGTLTVTPRMRVKVEFSSSLTFDQRLNSRFFVHTFRTLVNSDMIGQPEMVISASSCEPVKALNRREADDITAADLLILANDDFVDTMMDSFIDQKMDQGYLTAAVAAGSWTQTEIKDYIQNAYDNWTLPPSFVLFVGDQGDLTSFSAPTGMYSDNRYVCMDGASDYQADIFTGRFVTGTDNYPVVEQKILKWQFDPLMSADFWGNVLCAGYFQAVSSSSTVAQRWFCFTCETVRDTYMNIYGKTVAREYTKNTSAQPPYYYRSDLPSAGQQVPSDITWDGNAAGILASINSGVFLVQHRDHGGVTGWGDPSFHISDLAGLSNGEQTPMVMSVNCLTGKFNEDCFAENLFRMQGGAVGVLAATEVSYSYWNDYLCYGLYKSFNDEYTSPPALYTDPTGNYLTGQALMCSKIEMEASAPMCPYPTNRSETEWDLFHWFGDPTMDMRTEVPHSVTVSAPGQLPSGSTSAYFSVTDTNGSVENALVCMKHTSGLWVSGVTDSTGTVTLTFDPIGSLNEITWMVTAHNALPSEGIINGTGIEDMTTGIPAVSAGTPYPNPAASSVSFPVVLPASGSVSISIYDITGRTVDTVTAEDLQSGSHALVWNVTEVPQGVYMARINISGADAVTRRIVVSR
ncbi:hypothetical protein CSA37_03560 [Candidatus Fermentibacteria bacterium]|nr:MAG: hypothetical protein CSA37_03560 [Candidatus Fermentibacteria bacterium]